MATPEIPDKFYFKIGEVSSLLGVEPYVVRFWENEFNLRPVKNRSKHRIYKRSELETFFEIKRLLYEERFTIEGAQKKLRERGRDRARQLDLDLRDSRYKSLLKNVRKELFRIREILSR